MFTKLSLYTNVTVYDYGVIHVYYRLCTVQTSYVSLYFSMFAFTVLLLCLFYTRKQIKCCKAFIIKSNLTLAQIHDDFFLQYTVVICREFQNKVEDGASAESILILTFSSTWVLLILQKIPK